MTAQHRLVVPEDPDVSMEIEHPRGCPQHGKKRLARTGMGEIACPYEAWIREHAPDGGLEGAFCRGGDALVLFPAAVEVGAGHHPVHLNDCGDLRLTHQPGGAGCDVKNPSDETPASAPSAGNGRRRTGSAAATPATRTAPTRAAQSPAATAGPTTSTNASPAPAADPSPTWTTACRSADPTTWNSKKNPPGPTTSGSSSTPGTQAAAANTGGVSP